jgi:hypothetical protein
MQVWEYFEGVKAHLVDGMFEKSIKKKFRNFLNRPRIPRTNQQDDGGGGGGTTVAIGLSPCCSGSRLPV